MHKYYYFIIMPFLINPVHSNYFSLSLSIEIPLSLVLWLFTCHLTISSAVFWISKHIKNYQKEMTYGSQPINSCLMTYGSQSEINLNLSMRWNDIYIIEKHNNRNYTIYFPSSSALRSYKVIESMVHFALINVAYLMKTKVLNLLGEKNCYILISRAQQPKTNEDHMSQWGQAWGKRLVLCVSPLPRCLSSSACF